MKKKIIEKELEKATGGVEAGGKEESVGTALRRFKRQSEKREIINELRKREFYQKPILTRKKRTSTERSHRFIDEI